MKVIVWIAASAIGLLAMTQTVSAASFEVQEVQNSAVPQVWLLENHNLPVVSVKLAIRYAGAIADPKGKPGMANLFSDMLGRGAGDYDNLAFKQLLEDLAISLSFSVDKDHLYVDMRTLSEHADDAFRLMALALAKPRFEEQEFLRTREQAYADLIQKLEEPAYLASLKWNQVTYGDHPYGQPLYGSRDSIPIMTDQDMKDFASEHIGRTAMAMSVVGDITPDALKVLLETHLATVPQGSPPVAPPAFTAYPKGSIVRIEKPFPQSVAVFGAEGVGPRDPDYYAASLADYVLGGGGFESRLMNEIREKRGLAYSVYTYLQTMECTDGLKGSVATRNDAIDTSLELVKSEMRKIHDTGVTADELAAAKHYLTGSFILGLDSTGNLADYLSFMQLEGLGTDYLQRRNDRLEAVTLEEVNTAAKKLFDPERLIITVVGGKTGR